MEATEKYSMASGFILAIKPLFVLLLEAYRDIYNSLK
jgi:hypothetical protein